jgi:hypothetical protein
VRVLDARFAHAGKKTALSFRRRIVDDGGGSA